MSDQRPSVNVHVASSDVPLGAPHPKRKQRLSTFMTVVLTSDEPVKQVLRPDPNRVVAYVQAGGYNVVLTRTKGEGQAAANTGDPTYARPAGTLLPYGNSAPYPLETNGEVWAASASYPAQVAVTIVTEAD